MAAGLLALLDDMAMIARAAATALDDASAAAAKAGAKSAGVVIDDAAVTPGYVIGFSPARELPIVLRIAKGSLFNKLVLIGPALLALSAVAPWALTPLLALGALYLVYEGAEKAMALAGFGHESHAPEARHATPQALEEARVEGAVRTDLILSAEIMVIALATVADRPLVTQALALAVVAVGVTAGVYGAVALIVKADDFGAALVRGRATLGSRALSERLGRGLLNAMPSVLSALGVIGTAAMLWVGGGILRHAVGGGHAEAGDAHGEGHAEAASTLGALVGWAGDAAVSAVVGLVVGLAVVWAAGRAKALLARG
jgi:predicted DNA repair protein MutK